MKKLTVLVASLNAVGHVNACLGATKSFIRHGHRVIVVLEKAFQGQASPAGFEESIYNFKEEAESLSPAKGSDDNPGEALANNFFHHKIIGPYSIMEKMESIIAFFKSGVNFVDFKVLNAAVDRAIKQFEPVVIFYDHGTLVPCIYYSGIPYVRVVSSVPNYFENDDELPPGGHGFSLDSDPKVWKAVEEKCKFMRRDETFAKNFLEPLGYAPFPNDENFPDGILTVYGYPEEFNYPALQRRANWFNLEVFNRCETEEDFTLESLVPETFFNEPLDGHFSGKWIYVSMGSMGSVDLDMMNRLLSVLSTTKHKYIVSKGPRHEEYELPRNMWGDRYLPQTKIVPLVDLVVTHGGNNSVTETFAEGKPMIVLPLFADQYDNAQRLHETGFGIRIEPYDCDQVQKELVPAIDKLLHDKVLPHKLKLAAKRIQNSTKCDELVRTIEQLLQFN